MFEQKIPVHKVALNFKCYNEVADFFYLNDYVRIHKYNKK